MKFFDLDHPSFRPLWIRIAVVTICIGWALFEFATGAPFWGILFAGFGGVSAWRFATIDYSKEPDD